MDRGGVAINNIYTCPITPHQDRFYKQHMWKTGYSVLRAFCFSGLLIVFAARTSPSSASLFSLYPEVATLCACIHFIATAVCVHNGHLIRLYIKRHMCKYLHRNN